VSVCLEEPSVAELDTFIGAPYDLFENCLVIMVDDEALKQASDEAQWANKKKSRYLIDSLEKIPGRYWAVGYHNGCMCYKQEPGEGSGGNDQQLFFAHGAARAGDPYDGWYVSTCLDADDKNRITYAYGQCRDEGGTTLWPEALHTPANAKTVHPHVHVLSYSTYCELEMQRMQHEHLQLQQQQQQQQQPKKDKSDYPKKENHSGWLNRALPLMAAVLDRRWTTAEYLAEKLAQEPTAYQLIWKFTKHWKAPRDWRGASHSSTDKWDSRGDHSSSSGSWK